MRHDLSSPELWRPTRCGLRRAASRRARAANPGARASQCAGATRHERDISVVRLAPHCWRRTDRRRAVVDALWPGILFDAGWGRPVISSGRAKTAEDIRGLEFDWLATDEAGCTGLFTTAGAGYAPNEFLRDTEAHDAAIDEILALPASSAAKFAPTLPSDLVNTWLLVAERGLYAFDSDPNGGPYHCVAAPVTPVRLGALPERVGRLVAEIRLGFRFDDHPVITDDLLNRSRNGLPGPDAAHFPT